MSATPIAILLQLGVRIPSINFILAYSPFRLLIRTAGAHPFIHFGQLKLPQAPDAMCGKLLAFSPAINGVLGDAQVLGDVFGSNPRFSAHFGEAQLSSMKVV
jgi:hypothetical protein